MTAPFCLIATLAPLADDDTAACATTPEGLVVVTRRHRQRTLYASLFAGNTWSELGPIALDVGGDGQGGPLAYYDGEQLVVGNAVGRGLVFQRADRTHSLAIDLPCGRRSAIHDPVRKRVVLAAGGACFAIEGNHVVALPSRGEDVALSVGAGRVIAVGERTVAELDGDEWRELLPLPARRISTVAFDPGRSAHLTLGKTSAGLELFALDGDRFVSVARLSQGTFDCGVLLGWDPVKAAMVVHGGRDSSRANVPLRKTFVLTERDKLRSAGDFHVEHTDQRRTALNVEDQLVVVEHEDRCVRSLEGSGLGLRSLWQTQDVDVVGRFGNRSIAVAAGVDAHGRAVFVVDGLGGVWRLADDEPGVLPNQRTEALALGPQPEVSPDRRGGCALVWDEVEARLVLHGGEGRADTWIFRTVGPEAGAWRKLDTPHPTAGMAALVGTRRGVFALVGDALFRLDGDHWRPSRPAPSKPESGGWHGVAWLFHDRIRDALVVVRGALDGGELLVWSREGLTRIATLALPIEQLLWAGSFVGLDPTQDRLVMLIEEAMYACPLSILGDGPIGLPEDAEWSRRDMMRPD